LRAWTTALEKTLAGELVGVIVYGSAVRGEYRPSESDVDAVIVVEHARLEDLRAIRDATQLARWSARIESMVVVASELEGAADVFPLLYDEIGKEGVTIVGTNPFASIRVQDRHRRLRIEQELREAQIRLRRAAVDAGDDAALAGAILRKTRQIRAPLAALFALRGEPSETSLAAVLEKARAVYGVATDVLAAAHEKPAEAHAALVALLTKAIDDVNAREGSS
jgi:predicted nucleotidyltransferase